MRTIDMPHEVKSPGWNNLVYINLLDDFLSSSHELLWAIDTNKKIILANQAYKRFVYEATGEYVRIDDPVLPHIEDINMSSKWDHFYDRALQGERFSVITNYLSSRRPVMIDTSFIPIVYSHHIMGTACIARNPKVKVQGDTLMDAVSPD
jgi:hypothetical protein